ncbi:nitroreductase family protein [Deinococcus sp.]|uniref:nitroreductase family protein n=1 Tax=Deinococcus sp. TaxID=47478 RepID=UPI0025D9FE66|nr:nitroreductase family protein [Deinococcus sp.]
MTVPVSVIPTRAQTPPTQSPDEVRAFFAAHRTVRRYQPSAMPAEHLDTILYAAQRAPTDATAQLYSLIRLTGEIRERVAELSGNAHIAAASESFVICADAYRVRQFVAHGGAEPGHSPTSDLHFALGDAVLAGQNMLLAAEMLGYQGCWIGGVMNAPGDISELLALPPGVLPFAALTIGLSAEDTPQRPRLPRELVVHENRYRLPSPEELAAAAEIMNPIAARPGQPGNWVRLLCAYFAVGGSMEKREGPLRRLLRRQQLEGDRQ